MPGMPPVTGVTRGMLCYHMLGGFNFILFWNFNRSKTENDRYWQKKLFTLLQNVWKCTVFFAFPFKVCKKCYYDPKISWKISIWEKTQNFMLISNSMMPAFKNVPIKVKSKKPWKNAQKRKHSNFEEFFGSSFF